MADLFRVFATFALVVWLVRRGINLGVVMIAASLLFGLLYLMAPNRRVVMAILPAYLGILLSPLSKHHPGIKGSRGAAI